MTVRVRYTDALAVADGRERHTPSRTPPRAEKGGVTVRARYTDALAVADNKARPAPSRTPPRAEKGGGTMRQHLVMQACGSNTCPQAGALRPTGRIKGARSAVTGMLIHCLRESDMYMNEQYIHVRYSENTVHYDPYGKPEYPYF